MGQPNTQGGHMSYIPYSAFDPIFFLHHANVDRIFAMWQAIHPESWVEPQPAVLPSYTISKGDIQNSSTALTPFFANNDGSFWTSDGVRDHTRFGYTYADVSSGPKLGKRSVASVKRAINRLYGQSSTASLLMREGSVRGLGNSRVAVPARQGGNKQFSAADLLRGAVFTDGRYREWIVNIRVKKQALPEPFAVHLFLGEVPADTQQWPYSTTHAGTMGVFNGAGTVDGMSMGRLEVSGTVPLTTILVNKIAAGELSSLDPKDVEKFLKQWLRRRVLGMSGKVYDISTVQGLVMDVTSSVVKAPATEDELPEWGTVECHFRLE